jgi:hypothetical protein
MLGAVTCDCDRAVEGYNGNDELAEVGIDFETSSWESGANSDPLVFGHFSTTNQLGGWQK